MPIISPKEFMKTYDPKAAKAEPDKPVQAPKPPAPPSTMQDFGKGAAHGVTMGFSDELAGLDSVFGQKAGTDPSLKNLVSQIKKYIGGDASPVETYKQGRDAERIVAKEAEARSPYAYGGGDFLGSLAPAAATGGETFLPKLAGYFAQGATRGLGTSEGETVGEDVANTLGGGLTAGALGKVGEGIGKVAKPFINAFVPRFAGKNGPLEKEVARLRRQADRGDEVAAKRIDDIIEEQVKLAQRADRKAMHGAEEAMDTFRKVGPWAGGALGSAAGGAVGGPIGIGLGGGAGALAGKGISNHIENSLNNTMWRRRLPGAQVQDIDSHAIAVVLNAMRNAKPRQYGKVAERGIATPIGGALSGIAGGSLNAMGDVISAPFYESDPSEQAQQEIEAQTNPAAREAERAKRGQ